MQKDFSFNRRDTSRFGGSNQRSGGRSSGNRSGGNFDRPMMFDAVCAKCGKNCQVPFKPTGNRDVFCSNCFERDNDRDDRGGNRNFNRDSGRDSNRESRFGGDKEMFSTVCDKCGKDCEVPFKPTSGKPVYCSDCFTKSDGRYDDKDRNDRSDRSDRKSSSNNSGSADNGEMRKQLDAMNRKIDDIQKMISSMQAPEIKGLSAVDKFFEKETPETKVEVNEPVKKETVNKEEKKTVKKKPVKKAAKKAVKKA